MAGKKTTTTPSVDYRKPKPQAKANQPPAPTPAKPQILKPTAKGGKP